MVLPSSWKQFQVISGAYKVFPSKLLRKMTLKTRDMRLPNNILYLRLGPSHKEQIENKTKE